jgi:hypothetical protein
MTLRGLLGFVVLTLAFAAATSLGWWAVPATAALWGALLPSVRRPALVAALAAALAWAGWLLVDGISGSGAFGILATRLSILMHLPSVALVVLTLGFAAVLAWSAAVVAGAGVERLRR